MNKSPDRITINEIAQIAGVSKSTVSRVIDGSPRISDCTKKKVLSIIEEHGYIPNATARNLAKQRTNIIGIILPQGESGIYSTTYFQEVLKGICSQASLNNFDVMLASGNPTELDAINRLVGMSRVDGIILLRSKVEDSNVKALSLQNFPFVLIGTCLENPNIYCVDNDNVNAAADLTGHVAAAGKNKIAFIGGKKDSVVTIKRLEGYFKKLKELNLPINQEYIKLGQFSEEHGYIAVEQLLNLENPPDGILIMDDTMCMGAVRQLNEKGVRIPEQIAIACFNDSKYTRFSKPSFTAVSMNFYELGREAVKILVSVLDNKIVSTGCKYAGYKLIIRHSTSIDFS